MLYNVLHFQAYIYNVYVGCTCHACAPGIQCLLYAFRMSQKLGFLTIAPRASYGSTLHVGPLEQNVVRRTYHFVLFVRPPWVIYRQFHQKYCMLLSLGEALCRGPMAFLWLDPGSASCFLIYAVSQLATYIVGMLQATAISTRELTTVDTEAPKAIHLVYSDIVCLPVVLFCHGTGLPSIGSGTYQTSSGPT